MFLDKLGDSRAYSGQFKIKIDNHEDKWEGSPLINKVYFNRGSRAQEEELSDEKMKSVGKTSIFKSPEAKTHEKPILQGSGLFGGKTIGGHSSKESDPMGVFSSPLAVGKNYCMSPFVSPSVAPNSK